MNTSPTGAGLAWSQELVAYDFGAGHPMAPVRLALTADLIEALGVAQAMVPLETPVAVDEDLALVHEPAYIEAVHHAQATGEPDTARGLGDADTPVFGALHDASARLAGATLAAARAVAEGTVLRAFSPAGGMHHAMPGRAAGFCVYNDVALAVAYLRSQGLRVVYLDLDAHHGDGVERALWDDPDALTISVHQHPDTLFPGTGFAQDLGGAQARGSAVNVALPPGTGDAGWLRAIEAVVDPLVAEFAPDVIVSQHGADAHLHDPLAHLCVSVDAQRAAARHVAGLAQTHAGGRWVATGGGGYEVMSVVPRSWAHLAAVVADVDVPVDVALPPQWRAQVKARSGQEAPWSASDTHDTAFAQERHVVVGDMAQVRLFWQGFDPADDLDRAILATRQAAFPWHGLDPVTA